MTESIRIGDIVVFSCEGFLANDDPIDINEDNEPLRLRAGKGKGHPMQKILAFALVGMKVQDKKIVRVPYSEAFGKRDMSLLMTLPVEMLPPNSIAGIKVSKVLALPKATGEHEGRVISIGEDMAQVDFNHEYAGQDLYFHIQIISFERPKLGAR